MFRSSLSSNQGDNNHKNDLYASVWTWLLPCVHISLAQAVFRVQVPKALYFQGSPMWHVCCDSEDYDLLNLTPSVRSPHASVSRDDWRGLSTFTSARCVTPASLKGMERRHLVASYNPYSKAGLYRKSTLIHPQDA